MKILLDTHAWLWMVTEPDRFSASSAALLASPENELFLSAASSWEIAVKYAAGKLALPLPPAEYVPDRMAATVVRGLPTEHRHTLAVGALPAHHRDPFDRLLIAQALVEALPILTSDAQISRYDVETIPAS